MAKAVVSEPSYVRRLTAALERAFPEAQLTHEQIRRDRYRFILVDESFEGVGHPERQARVWDIADKAVAKGDLLKIGMIITMAPSESSEE